MPVRIYYPREVMEVETELAAEPTSVSDSQQQGELAVTDSAKHETRRDVDPRHSIVSCDQSNGARPLLPVRGGKLQQSDTLKPRDPFEQKGWVKSWRRVEVVLLSGCIVIVWGLLFLPVVFYHLPTEEVRWRCQGSSLTPTCEHSSKLICTGQTII